ncbi:hypothetical protein ACH8ZP_02750 [Chlamydia pneumoniae]|uniref:Uncharacterized protein n=1 Tax=Chlamydia pneumoniae TaxID=83558 RepID=Q9Z7Z9_CHLPN|nr:hypothetical protein [Chlamydia pneumoniae]AAD18693.1 hypothetical protein CPn_0553 [Chlamydia pneumoniae CWL029]AAF38072.1 hypothetical protein CP_0199 [Chlamydia pneumoniae AR39]CRI33064.1 Uncharacterized protein BN1224_Wien1_A_05710 [Chlamydia pneumoniae]CRI35927.1 Uncharacterized protein BN1224_CM1_A_05740 [Chlamydia pneumoniae]CRI37054.1 Uncharacterized protein BN1224_CV14_A_05730 [Chlamydia pneumoniae]
MWRVVLRFLIIFILGRAVFPLRASESFSWETSTCLTVLGIPFIDIILTTNEDFVAQCGLQIGTISSTNNAKIKEIFLIYKEKFPEASISFKRKEPLNLSQSHLSDLGILCMRNGETYAEGMANKENGPALKQPKDLRLVLRCPNQPDTLLYSEKEAEKGIETNTCLCNQGYTLLDGQLILYGDSIEKFLKETKRKNNHTLVDLCDSQVVTTFLGRFWSLLNYVQVLFLSEDSAKILAGIPDLAQATQLLSHTVPLLFIYTNDSIHIIEQGKESSFTYNQDLTEPILGFLFGYINRGSMEYCFNCAQSSLGET